MKKYVLCIDTSASSPENVIRISEAKTIKEAKNQLSSLNLKFGCAFIYCAIIAEKQKGSKNRYSDILRTDDGLQWGKQNIEIKEEYKHYFKPEGWITIEEWKTITYYQNKTF